jgi:hypothetical protein
VGFCGADGVAGEGCLELGSACWAQAGGPCATAHLLRSTCAGLVAAGPGLYAAVLTRCAAAAAAPLRAGAVEPSWLACRGISWKQLRCERQAANNKGVSGKQARIKLGEIRDVQQLLQGSSLRQIVVKIADAKQPDVRRAAAAAELPPACVPEPGRRGTGSGPGSRLPPQAAGRMRGGAVHGVLAARCDCQGPCPLQVKYGRFWIRSTQQPARLALALAHPSGRRLTVKLPGPPGRGELLQLLAPDGPAEREAATAAAAGGGVTPQLRWRARLMPAGPSAGSPAGEVVRELYPAASSCRARWRCAAVRRCRCRCWWSATRACLWTWGRTCSACWRSSCR